MAKQMTGAQFVEEFQARYPDVEFQVCKGRSRIPTGYLVKKNGVSVRFHRMGHGKFDVSLDYLKVPWPKPLTPSDANSAIRLLFEAAVDIVEHVGREGVHLRLMELVEGRQEAAHRRAADLDKLHDRLEEFACRADGDPEGLLNEYTVLMRV